MVVVTAAATFTRHMSSTYDRRVVRMSAKARSKERRAHLKDHSALVRISAGVRVHVRAHLVN
ncbi:hypothetical protein POSPLADRAFT_1055238 [Postia placenta MAD-698-R-SB12]|uniref:Uncharacterized protein n=1 Tax=Postia placenta MAD-698-R-SB12 TaxID=670580 RepID=A0A1X6N3I1_9APHY|nr:hypothetical protein POSPLADRAFT_1055238 [Postia placenta MAD-698-R-SB12]OSX63174.1 hypothetical protein POSPLADRAFT_1055238 [Postia placenta MAD-698-R-SB12]